ncbi:hypothetical protein O6H91_Y282300 [Diphasiastrum complanatum]|nr:hypothetical protein O6H91_Y282300 [Diphasiastrum complanatum]
MDDQLQEPEEMLARSSLTADDFKPIKVVGYGDMGTVFLAILRGTNQVFAVKVMNKEVLKVRANLHRAEREREILSMLSYPFLPSLYAHFESEQNVFLVMNYCSGGDLSVLKQKQLENKFLETTVRFYAAEVLLALEQLHKLGIAYRDLKPENVLIQQDGHVMLTDFDLSVILPNNSAIATHNNFSAGCKLRKLRKRMSIYLLLFACTASRQHVLKPASGKRSLRMRLASRVFPLEFYGRKSVKKNTSAVRSYSFVGTEEYVAPEILWGTGHGTPVDWWTFGVFLYEMVYGTTPFKGENRKETFHNILTKEPDLPNQCSSLNDLIQKLLVKEPDKRLGSKVGAIELKEHPFFNGIEWNELQHISRPPYVPNPFSLEEDEEDNTDIAIKSDAEIELSTAQVAGSSQKLSKVQTQCCHDIVMSSWTASLMSSEDPFLPLSNDSNLTRTERSFQVNASRSSDSEIDQSHDKRGQQVRKAVDSGQQRIYDRLCYIENMMSRARLSDDKPVSSLPYVQPEEPISHCRHLIRTCERTCIHKLGLCLQACGSCFLGDSKDRQEESKEDFVSWQSSLGRNINIPSNDQENQSKISSVFIQRGANESRTEVVPCTIPSFISSDDEEDEFFDIELAMEQLAKKNFKLQESEPEEADQLFEVF